MNRIVSLFFFLAFLSQAAQVVSLPGKSPLVSIRIVFRTGAASDPADRPGLANMTCELLGNGGTQTMTYQQIVDALFPMAVGISSYTDKEMMTFTADTHVDNLYRFYTIFKSMLLTPGFREDDFRRIKDQQINALKNDLRSSNDEELGKEQLYSLVYAGHPYGRENLGTLSSLETMTIDEVKNFYKSQLTQDKLTIGLAGGYPPEFLARVQKDFASLPATGAALPKLPNPPAIDHTRLTIVQKDTRSVAYSLGFPIGVKRGDPDFPALLLVQSYFGQHRESGGRLYQRMRELRGLNYGDYAYIEYFPRGMFQFEPDPNLARQQQIFQIWIRPVEPPTAGFALRLAMFELDHLVKAGLTQEEFDRSRSFLQKYVNLLTKTKSAELGYAIDSAYYGIPNYNQYLKGALAKLTLEQVNSAIKRHLRPDRVQIVAIAKDADALKRQLTSPDATPMTYNSPKPEDITTEDKTVEKWATGLRPTDVTIVPIDQVFQ